MGTQTLGMAIQDAQAAPEPLLAPLLESGKVTLTEIKAADTTFKSMPTAEHDRLTAMETRSLISPSPKG